MDLFWLERVTRFARGLGAIGLTGSAVRSLGVLVGLDMQALRRQSWALVVATLCLTTSPAKSVSGQDASINFQALAVNMSNIGTRGANVLDIRIERWTTDAEVAQLRAALVERGSEALMNELQKIKPRAGSIRSSSGGLGWNLLYARKRDLPGGGRRIVFASDRPMSFYELATRPRSAEYDFMLAEMHINANGKGDGKLVPAARIKYDEASRTIEIENYANEPVLLTDIRESKAK